MECISVRVPIAHSLMHRCLLDLLLPEVVHQFLHSGRVLGWQIFMSLHVLHLPVQSNQRIDKLVLICGLSCVEFVHALLQDEQHGV